MVTLIRTPMNHESANYRIYYIMKLARFREVFSHTPFLGSFQSHPIFKSSSPVVGFEGMRGCECDFLLVFFSCEF